MIGTQMVAKGLNFDNVTLVGVLFADQSLFSGDYRAGERCFSLLTQVIGRSGRAERKGRAVIQTFTPENPIIRFAAKQDYEAFYQRELEVRQMQRCPPFAQLLTLTVIGADELQILRACEQIRELLRRSMQGEQGVDVLGPAPYPVVKAAGKYRYRLTIRSSRNAPVHGHVTKLLNYCNREREFRGISVYADRNPQE
jgi:primosomal protein N' (replication factor Y)